MRNTGQVYSVDLTFGLETRRIPMIRYNLRDVRFLLAEKCEQFEFDDGELEMVLRNDRFVINFVEDNDGDVEATVAAILKCLVYRNKYQVYSIKASDMPMELYAWNIKTGRDIYGEKICWANFGCHRKIPELVDYILKVDFLNLTMNSGQQAKYDVYADLRNASFKCLDMRLSRKMASMVTTCFPNLVGHLYVCGMPAILSAVLQTMVKMLPSRHRNKISFITVEQARERVLSFDSCAITTWLEYSTGS
ncbi:hypothetical protein HDE_06086 [Halotydeus destructor]|nr:hypothetical protein HDE_06086 [Halotydeus destructor]